MLRNLRLNGVICREKLRVPGFLTLATKEVRWTAQGQDGEGEGGGFAGGYGIAGLEEEVSTRLPTRKKRSGRRRRSRGFDVGEAVAIGGDHGHGLGLKDQQGAVEG